MSIEALCEQLRQCRSLSEREAILQADALQADALQADALQADALQADALQADALRADTLRADALQADTLRADGLSAVLDRARSILPNSPAEAQELAAITAEIAYARKELPMAASANRVQGQAYRLLGRHLEAIQAFQAAADAACQAGDLRLAAQVRIGSVDSLGMLGRYDEAIALAKSLETALLAMGAEEEAARVLFNAGSLHFRRDQYARALECYERAGKILEKGDDPTILARIWSNCANALTHLNRLDEAIPLYEQARLRFVERTMTVETAFVDTNLGYLHFVSGNHALAVASLVQARKEFQERGRETEAARCAIDLGEAYRALNLLPEAVECYTQAVAVLEQVGVEYDRARAELGLAATLRAPGHQDEALARLSQAETIFRSQKNTLQVAHVHLVRAYLLRAGGQREAARQEAHTAAKTFTRNRLPGWAAEARFLLAEMALDQDPQGPQAHHGVTRAMQSVVRTAQKTARGWLECRAEHALGRYYVRQGQIQQALNHLRAGAQALLAARTRIAPEEMHVAFLKDKLSLYEDLVGTLLVRGNPDDIEEALEYVELSRSRLLLERMQAALEGPLSAQAPMQETLEKITALRSALSRGYHQLHRLMDSEARRLTQESPADREALIPLERAYAAALQDVERSKAPAAQALLNQTAAVAAKDLRACLQPKETLVEFYTIRDQVCAFVVSPERVQILQGITCLEEVQFATRRLRYQLRRLQMPAEYAILVQEQLRTGIQEVLKDLYEMLLRPLEPLLAEKVVVVPHGILHGLPFHAFYDGGQYALDRWEFLYAPSAAVWHAGVQSSRGNPNRASARKNERHALILGVPDAGMERIGEEVAAVARCLPGATVFCGKAATLEAFQTWAGRSTILHLATHALFRNDNPLFSGLQFTDGWLLARDLYGMTLDCDLATLSACQTGVSVVEAGDELFGLIRGFLGAGVRSLAASLWSADDAATACLMDYFYTHLSQGKSLASALRCAQQQTREIYPHPYYWAAFALVGRREQKTEMSGRDEW